MIRNLRRALREISLTAAAAIHLTVFGGACFLGTTANATSPELCAPLNPAAQGWQLSFDDTFDRLDASDGEGSRWQTRFVGGERTIAANRERELYVDSSFTGLSGTSLGLNPFTLRPGGGLIITAWAADEVLREKIGVPKIRYLSGLLTTAHSFRQVYGYFEMRARMPQGRGLWPAFWLLPADGRWPPEIDIFEVLGQDPTELFVTVHTAESGRHKYTTFPIRVADQSRDFHRYGLLWTSQRLSWFFDGCLVAEARTPRDLHVPMYMLVNLAVGGHWPGYPDRNTRFPAELLVDYVRAYRFE